MSAADLVFSGGPVYTSIAGRSVDALAVRGGKIVALGRDQVAPLRGPATEYVDLAGSALLPGFQDAHAHPILAGLQQLGCDLSASHDLTAYRRAITAFAHAHPEAVWVEGSGWYGDVFPSGFPDRAELDSLVPDRPAVLRSHDAHSVWVNSAALRLAGVRDDTPDPTGGCIQRGLDGAPTGVLMESAADLVTRLLPPPSADLMERALRQAQTYLHSLGITAWQDAAVGEAFGIPDPFKVYCDADRQGWLTARVTGALWWHPDRGLEQLDHLSAQRAAAPGRRFQTPTVKVMQDGVCENLTAAVLTAYQGHPGQHGMSMFGPDQLREVVTAVDAAGFDVHFHAVGDRAVRECLDALDALPDRPDRRPQIAHLDLIDPADLSRMRRLGVIANVQPLWARRDPVLVQTKLPYLDAKQQRNHFAFESLRAGGIDLAMGSDWPVSDPNPLWAIHTATQRTAPAQDPHAQDEHSQRVPLLPDEAIPIAAAIAAATIGAARANRLEDRSGSLEVGKAADLAVLGGDPYTVPVRELADLRVRYTFVAGQLVFHGG